MLHYTITTAVIDDSISITTSFIVLRRDITIPNEQHNIIITITMDEQLLIMNWPVYPVGIITFTPFSGLPLNDACSTIVKKV